MQVTFITTVMVTAEVEDESVDDVASAIESDIDHAVACALPDGSRPIDGTRILETSATKTTNLPTNYVH